MEKINDLTGKSVKQWEDAVAYLRNVRLEEVRIHHGKVVGATGSSLVSGHETKIKWLWDGRAFIYNRRAEDYDLKFN